MTARENRKHDDDAGDSRECRRLVHRVHALQETVHVLRVGANSLAIDNTLLRIENERLRDLARVRESRRN